MNVLHRFEPIRNDYGNAGPTQPANKPTKPLGGKAYGSIPHFPGSRMGPADHHCHDGQLVIATQKLRDRHDRVVVTEKLDGACMSIAKIDGKIVPITRAGYHAEDGAYEHLRDFAPWVAARADRFDRALTEGQRFCGEWLHMAHGTIYKLADEPFVVFDLIIGKAREPHDRMVEAAQAAGLQNASVISDGSAISVEAALDRLGVYGQHGATEAVEGAVWRVERKGAFDFMAKYVRPDKVDGKYLPNVSGKPAIYLTATLSPSSPVRGSAGA